MLRKHLFSVTLLSVLTLRILSGRPEAQQAETQLAKTAESTTPTAVPHGEAGAPLPTGKELTTKRNIAIGGLEVWNKSTSRRMKGVYQTEDTSAFFTIEILQKAPNKSLSKITFPNGVVLREVCDGHTAWREDSLGRYSEFTGAALASKMRQAEFQDRARIEQLASTGRVTGIEKVGAHTAYVLEFSPDKKLRSKLYFDADNGFIVRSEDTFSTSEGPYIVKLDLDDYREIEGMKFPFRMKRVEKGAVLNIRLTQVTINPNLDDTLFLKPEFAK